MAILSGDVKLLKSAIMADVDEGGGAPTGNLIADGVSNAIFPDISELDRAGGRVSLRKTFASVHTSDTNTYFGANVIVAEPPQDPRVSVTLFSTESTFDTRLQASTRIESYLNMGAEYAGFLYENHIAGQRVVQFLQRPNADLPNVGQTLVLIQNEGAAGEKTQYVRATSVSGQIRLFYDAQSGKDYEGMVVTMEISDALRYDFTGSAANRSFVRNTTATKVRETIVADAGTYVGVVPLDTAAAIGDFTVSATSIYTQLVPSAQTETPISDVKTNGVSAALTATGGPLTQTLSMTFNTTTSMHVGGPIYPGSLTIVRAGITLNDAAGILYNAGAQVGTVDYNNGIVALSTDVFGASSASHTVTFTPATVPDLISSQSAIRVTAESRSLSYVLTLGNIPLPQTLAVSYMAQGRWYVLRENGAGVIKGSDAAFGTGTLNFTTGSIVLTLGALPDVGSAIVISSYSNAATTTPSNTELLNDGKFYVPINTSGQMSEEKGTKSIQIGGLTVGWTNGGAKVAHDDGAGNITGDATGTVDYSAGVIRLSPNTLPASGTVFLVDVTSNLHALVGAISVGSGSFTVTNIVEGSVSFTLTVAVTWTWHYGAGGSSTYNASAPRSFPVFDKAGKLYIKDVYSSNRTIEIGTVNYVTGAFTINLTPTPHVDDTSAPLVQICNLAISASDPASYTTTTPWNNVPANARVRELSINPLQTFDLTYSASTPGTDSISAVVTQYVARTGYFPNYSLRGVEFTLGSDRYFELTDGSLVKNHNPSTGLGTPAGTVTGAAGVVTISSWTTGVSSTITNWRGLMAPPTVGTTSPFTEFQSIFRTASAPLRPGSFSILGTMQDGTTFNVTAGIDGKINGTRVKGKIDYEFGLVQLYFVKPGGNANLNVDLTFLGISGLSTIPSDLVQLNSLRYNAVAYSYLPLDASILGIDPVRLPSDGKVPIFRPGGFAVVGHTGEITATVSNGQTVDCARVRLSRVRIIGNDGVVINTGYTANLEAGTVTFTSVAGYSQPVTIQHRIEDMAIIRETQISGEISFTRALTHAYPLGSYVSSALIAGDMFARVSLLFDQATWNGTFTDTVNGSAATGTFNRTTYPIEVTNKGALTERWTVQFTNSTSFNVIGENVGVIATGNTSTNCAPINPNTSVPYFTIPALGWGSGWATGNVLRFNTIGAEFPVWVVRTVQQGPETVPNDSFTLLIRGDVDTP